MDDVLVGRRSHKIPCPARVPFVSYAARRTALWVRIAALRVRSVAERVVRVSVTVFCASFTFTGEANKCPTRRLKPLPAAVETMNTPYRYNYEIFWWSIRDSNPCPPTI